MAQQRGGTYLPGPALGLLTGENAVLRTAHQREL